MFSLKLLTKTLRPIFMDGVQLSQGYKSRYEERVSFLPLGSQDFLVLIYLASEG